MIVTIQGVTDAPTPAPACYRHSGRETFVRCARCERSICPDCMTTAPVGFHCPVCVAGSRREARRQNLRGLRRRLATPRTAVIVLVVVGLLAGLAFLQDRLASVPPASAGDLGYFSQDWAPEAEGSAFDGTPAAAFAEGTAGWADPRTISFAGWTPAQTRQALDQVRDALTAIYLDERALVRHDPSAVLPLLAPGHRAAFAQGFATPSAASTGVLISPDVRLADEQPRVDGRTTVRAVTERGRHPLEITTNYVVVYPFDVEDFGPGSRTGLVHAELTWRIYPLGEATAPERGLMPVAGTSFVAYVDCAEAERGFLAPSYGDDIETALDDPDELYDHDTPLDTVDGCA
jgi:hypothetical protein